MGSKKEYEEKLRHGTPDMPMALHKLTYPSGTDIIFYFHWHKEFEFFVVTEGKVRFSVEDREHILTKGDCMFVNSNFLHSAGAVDGCKCGFFAVDFSYELLDQDIHSRFAKRYIRPVLNGKTIFQEVMYEKDRKKNMWTSEIVKELEKINCFDEEEVELHELTVRAGIMKIWDIMTKHAEKKKEMPEDHRQFERIAPVVKYMKENYPYEISLSELANMIPMSEGQFCRIFKQTMKTTPMQYLLRLRILESCHLLQETDYKVGEVANRTGFNNVSYYNRVFLKVIGCTPKEYRLHGNL